MEEIKHNSNNESSGQTTKLKTQVDIMKILSNFWCIRKLLLKVAVIGAVVGLLISLSIPKQYLVKVTLTPELSGKSGGGLANMAASFLGASLSQSGPDAINAQLAPEIVGSTPFLLDLLNVQVFNPVTKKDSTLSAYLSTESSPWWNYVMKAPRLIIESVRSLFTDKQESKSGTSIGGPIKLTRKQEGKLRRLRNAIAVNVDKKHYLITLFVKFQNPIVTANVADSVVAKLQENIITYKISKAKADCDYWEKLTEENKEKYYTAQQNYARYVDANSNVVYQSTMVERERLQSEMSLAYQVYSQVEQQLQMAKAKVQESKPVFAILEPTVVPNVPTGVGKLQLMIVYAILAVLGTAFWQFIAKDFFVKLRSTINKSEKE